MNPSASHPEINAIRAIVEQLEPLDDAARKRVLRYLFDLFDLGRIPRTGGPVSISEFRS